MIQTSEAWTWTDVGKFWKLPGKRVIHTIKCEMTALFVTCNHSIDRTEYQYKIDSNNSNSDDKWSISKTDECLYSFKR